MSDYSSLTDQELLQLMKRYDRSAFEELYERHWLTSYNIAYKRLKESETSKDIVQDVFADLWYKREVSDIQNLPPYLHTSVRNKIYTCFPKNMLLLIL